MRRIDEQLRYDRRMTGRLSLEPVLRWANGAAPLSRVTLRHSVGLMGGHRLVLRAARQFILRVLFTHGTSGWANGRPPLSQGWRLKADSTGTRKTIAVEQAS